VKLSELVAQLRIFLDDSEKPGTGTTPDSDSLWSNDELVLYINKAIDEACLRARLIRDSSTPALVEIDLVADEAFYDIDNRVLDIYRAKIESAKYSMEQSTSRDLDRRYPMWEGLPSIDEPDTFITDLESHQIRLVPAPKIAGLLKLTVWRTQLKPLTWAANTKSPEIAPVHHFGLLNWARSIAYQKTDSETYDPRKSLDYAEMFTQEFGERPTARDLESGRVHSKQRVPARFM